MTEYILVMITALYNCVDHCSTDHLANVFERVCRQPCMTPFLHRELLYIVFHDVKYSR